MRSVLVFCAVVLALPPSLAGQDSTKTTRWALAAGPSWGNLTGARLRTEYALIRDRWFGFQLEAGGLWTPTQRFMSRFTYLDGTPMSWGWGQAVDLRVGAAATLSPFPRAGVSPYLIASVGAVQRWSSLEHYDRSSDGSVQRRDLAGTEGAIVFNMGLGIRARLGGRMFQLELRRGSMSDLTLGTRLPF